MPHRPFVVVGESLVDIVVPAGGESVHAPGGSPMNVAVGLSRLDVPTLLVTEVGDDEHGKQVVEHLRASGVTLSESSVRPGQRTSTATAHLDHTNAAAYAFDLTWDLPAQTLPGDVLGLHVGSLGTTIEPGRRSVVDLVRQASEDEVFVSFDFNVRPAFLGDVDEAWRDVLEIAGGATLVKMSDEDLEALQPGRTVEEVARDLLASSSTELVIVTFGPRGATAFTDTVRVHVDAPVVEVTDTVGAGDSFMAAVLAVLVDWDLTTDGPGALSALDEDRVSLLLSAAATAAATTCARRGANPPTRRELPPTWPIG
ncbi:MAG: PfkB family carbohydrate kinase [Nocardioidaceae bacterium]